MRVAHSIPDAAAVAIGTPVGTIVVTGDYKLDTAQREPAPALDRARLGALGRGGVLAVLGDSTNADAPGPHAVRGHDGRAARRASSASSPGASIVTCFASHIDRIDHAMRAADATGRAVTLLGRSMRRNLEIARAPRRGRAAAPADAAARATWTTLRPRRSLVTVTGSQAERERRPRARDARRAPAAAASAAGHGRLREPAGARQRGRASRR